MLTSPRDVPPRGLKLRPEGGPRAGDSSGHHGHGIDRPEPSTVRRRRRQWLVTFLVMAIAVFWLVHYFSGYEAIGAAARFLWNGVVYAANSVLRVSGNLVAAVARTVGMRRVARLAAALAGIGLGYAGSVILSDSKLRKAHGWRGRLRAAITVTRNKWVGLHLFWKLCIVAALIASQVYLHFLLIVFPIAFLVPVVRRAWTVAADDMVGTWYRKRMARLHDAIITVVRKVPGYKRVASAARLLRMQYLCAWRLWRYDRRYRDPRTGERMVSLVEPVRLWRQGKLDRYVGHPLLAGESRKGEHR